MAMSFVVASVANGAALDTFDQEHNAQNFADAVNKAARAQVVRVKSVPRNPAWSAVRDPQKIARTIASALGANPVGV